MTDPIIHSRTDFFMYDVNTARGDLITSDYFSLQLSLADSVPPTMSPNTSFNRNRPCHFRWGVDRTDVTAIMQDKMEHSMHVRTHGINMALRLHQDLPNQTDTRWATTELEYFVDGKHHPYSAELCIDPETNKTAVWAGTNNSTGGNAPIQTLMLYHDHEGSPDREAGAGQTAELITRRPQATIRAARMGTGWSRR